MAEKLIPEFWLVQVDGYVAVILGLERFIPHDTVSLVGMHVEAVGSVVAEAVESSFIEAVPVRPMPKDRTSICICCHQHDLDTVTQTTTYCSNTAMAVNDCIHEVFWMLALGVFAEAKDELPKTHLDRVRPNVDLCPGKRARPYYYSQVVPREGCRIIKPMEARAQP